MLKKISHLIKHQFPEFYRQSGDNFIAFMEAYYEWMEQEGKINNKIRSVTDLIDIDKTSEEFLKHFAKTYMAELPPEIVGNQRLFQKHVLDLYRSKGSEAGVRLLFRLLFNEDIGLYVPSYDIFAASDGKWVERKYIEVAYNDNFPLYQGRVITGMDTGARAFVENAISFTKRGFRVYALYITNIRGNFKVGESVKAEGTDMPFTEMLRVIGSPVEVDVIASGIGFDAGDIFEFSDHSDDMKLVVSETGTATGTMEFTLENGGTFYSMDANISITAGSNTSGGDALFEIASIKDIETFGYSIETLVPFGDVLLDANSYGFPTNPSANSSSLIINSITINEVDVGTIDRIRVINPGGGYDGSVNIDITDPYTATSIIPDGNGGFGGTNAVVTGRASMGVGTVLGLKIISSGHAHYENGKNYVIENEKGTVNFNVRLGGVGIEEGYFDNSDGFLSDGKYLFDGHYYQEYSYVIRSSKHLEDYREILINTVHSAGNALFGEIRMQKAIDFDIKSPPEYNFVRQLLEVEIFTSNSVYPYNITSPNVQEVNSFDADGIVQITNIGSPVVEAIVELFALSTDQSIFIAPVQMIRVAVGSTDGLTQVSNIGSTTIKQTHIVTTPTLSQPHVEGSPHFGYKTINYANNLLQTYNDPRPVANRIVVAGVNGLNVSYTIGNTSVSQRHIFNSTSNNYGYNTNTTEFGYIINAVINNVTQNYNIGDPLAREGKNVLIENQSYSYTIGSPVVRAIEIIGVENLVTTYTIESPMINGFLRETTDEDIRTTVDGRPRRTIR